MTGLVDARVEVVHDTQPMVERIEIHPQDKIERAVSKAFQIRNRCRIFENQLVTRGGFQQQRLHFIRIGSIRNSHLHNQPINLVRQRPIQQLAGDELFVGYNQLFAIEIDNCGGTNPNAGHRSRRFRQWSPHRLHEWGAQTEQ